MVEYHDILWDIGYAQTFEEAYERIENLYKEEEAGVEHQNPPVEDFLVWRDLRVFDGKLTLINPYCTTVTQTQISNLSSYPL
jgi:hypothetical protein